MKKNKVMILGAGKSGKTSIAHLLNGDTGPVKRTPNMVYGKNTLDVPGSYLESPWMHKHIIAAQQDASCVLMLVDPKKKKRSYPPMFSKSFRIPVLGVITKVDLAEDHEIEQCKEELASAGVQEPYLHFSLLDGKSREGLFHKVYDLAKINEA